MNNALEIKLLESGHGAVLRKQEAASSDTSSERLAELLVDSHMSVRRQAALNPNVPQELLGLLFRMGGSSDLSSIQDPDPTLKSQEYHDLIKLGQWGKLLAARHPETTAVQLDMIYEEADRAVKLHLARHPNINPDLLMKLALDPVAEIRETAIQNLQMTEDLLARLVKLKLKQKFDDETQLDVFLEMDSEYAHILIAQHPQLNQSMFDRFVGSKNWKIREALLRNPELSSDHLRMVAKTLPVELLVPLVDHANTPGDLLESLLVISDMGVKSSMAIHPNATPGLLKVLMEDGAFRVRLSVLQHPAYPKSHHRLMVRAGSAEDLISQQAPDLSMGPDDLAALAGGGPWAIQLVCSHPNTLSQTLEPFVADANFMIRESIAKHPNRPRELINLMVKAGSTEDLQGLEGAKHELSSVEIEQLMSLGSWSRRLVSNYTDLDQQVISQLVTDTDWQIRRTMARRGDLPEALQMILAEDDSAEVRWSLLKCDKPAESVMQHLARDEMAQIRVAVAEHSAVSQITLRSLQWDMDGDVRALVAEKLHEKTTPR